MGAALETAGKLPLSVVIMAALLPCWHSCCCRLGRWICPHRPGVRQ
ncbi:hypothetical protein Hsero_1592 [Herbaspirillum seropedicae SmR1]|uniref:Uncharacterized protein n=1 Tax=Herbaspirillum seropedicae (strain SmR1) TaxID=757424 RepID=D8IQ59_HERSS|nr:hypothetical protein Hsero_1592 [Herbaspirillum seropedicae SmR1]